MCVRVMCVLLHHIYFLYFLPLLVLEPVFPLIVETLGSPSSPSSTNSPCGSPDAHCLPWKPALWLSSPWRPS